MNRDVVMVSWDGDAEVMVYEYRAVEGSTLVKVHGPFTSSPAAFTPHLSQPERVLEWVATGAQTVSLVEHGHDSHASLSALLAHTCAGGGLGRLWHRLHRVIGATSRPRDLPPSSRRAAGGKASVLRPGASALRLV